MEDYLRPLKYEDGKFLIIDQTLLPNEERWIELRTEEEFWDAIKTLKVRGAPAIGVTAAFGMAVSLLNKNIHDINELIIRFGKTKEYLAGARPTAVNLFWALNRMEARMVSEIKSESKQKESNKDKLAMWSCISGILTLCIMLVLFIIAVPILAFSILSSVFIGPELFKKVSLIVIPILIIIISFGILSLLLAIKSIKRSGKSKLATTGVVISIINLIMPMSLITSYIRLIIQ